MLRSILVITAPFVGNRDSRTLSATTRNSLPGRQRFNGRGSPACLPCIYWIDADALSLSSVVLLKNVGLTMLGAAMTPERSRSARWEHFARTAHVLPSRMADQADR